MKTEVVMNLWIMEFFSGNPRQSVVSRLHLRSKAFRLYNSINNQKFFPFFVNTMLNLLNNLFGGGSSVATISAQELKEQLQSPQKPVLLDVRQPEEHKQKHIPNSLLIPLGDLQHRIKELEKYKNKEIIVYCASGARSSSACRMLSAAGYSVRNLNGGMMMWR